MKSRNSIVNGFSAGVEEGTCKRQREKYLVGSFKGSQRQLTPDSSPPMSMEQPKPPSDSSCALVSWTARSVMTMMKQTTAGFMVFGFEKSLASLWERERGCFVVDLKIWEEP